MAETSILHIAPENTAGVPYNVMEMQRRFGFTSRLLTFYKIPFDFPEDICLNLTLPRGKLAMGWRKFKQSKLHENLAQNKINQYTHMPYFSPKNTMEKYYLKLREKKNQNDCKHIHHGSQHQLGGYKLLCSPFAFSESHGVYLLS